MDFQNQHFLILKESFVYTFVFRSKQYLCHLYNNIPCSHLEIVCLTTFSLMASSSCESPLDFLIDLMFSFNMLEQLLSLQTII